jgi:hypothetical protein
MNRQRSTTGELMLVHYWEMQGSRCGFDSQPVYRGRGGVMKLGPDRLLVSRESEVVFCVTYVDVHDKHWRVDSYQFAFFIGNLPGEAGWCYVDHLKPLRDPDVTR